MTHLIADIPANAPLPHVVAEDDDAIRLVEASRAGDREAYRQLVERYQGLVCAMALSACGGDLARSEDLAQETFLAAWQSLLRLEDPAKFKSWLCGIARNVIRDARRKHARRGWHSPSAAAGPAPAGDALPDETSPPPPESAIRNEEATMVRQALSGLPESYREPLVLFYREGQSIRTVAETLDLSEDTVRQRLSRGRNMLREQLAALVETCLARSKPGAAFTAAVVASLPDIGAQANVTTGAAVTVATAASTAGKAATGAGLVAFLASPLIALGVTPFVARWVGRAQRTPRERRYMVRFAWRIGILNTACALAIGALSLSPSFVTRRPVVFAVVLAGAIAVNVGITAWLSFRADRWLKRIRAGHKQP